MLLNRYMWIWMHLNPDLNISLAYGADGYSVKTIQELNEVLIKLKTTTDKPSLVQVVIPEKDLPDQMRRLGLE
jgi:indolepyruvate decarboxylase